MSKIKFSKYLVLISVFTFVTIFFSVVSKSYDNLIESTAEIETNPLIRSISPDLEIEVLDEIGKRQEILFSETENPPELADLAEPTL